MTAWKLPRESKELVGPITVTRTVDGVTTVVTDFTIAVSPYGTRPAGPFVAPTTVGADKFRLTGPATSDLPVGRYILWAKVIDSPEEPVIEVDGITIT